MCGVEMRWFECIPSLVTISEEKNRKKDVHFKAIVSRLRRETIADRISSFVPLKVDEKRCVESHVCENMDGEGWERS